MAVAEVSSTSESACAAQVVEDSFAVDRSCDEIAGVENCLLAGGLGCGDRLRRASAGRRKPSTRDDQDFPSLNVAENLAAYASHAG